MQAFICWNHPGWKGPELGRWGGEHTRLFEQGHLHGIEICNGDVYYDYAHQGKRPVNHIFNLASDSGTMLP